MVDKKLKIAVFHNLPAGGAIRALYDNMSYFKKDGHSIDIYTTEMSNKSFTPLEEVADNYYVFPIKRSIFRKIIFKIIEKATNRKFNEQYSKAFFTNNDFVNTQKVIAKEIDSKDYDFVFVDQDNMLYTFTPAIGKYLKTLKIHYCHQPHRDNEQILISLAENYSKPPIYLKIYNKLFGDKYRKLNLENAQYMDYILCNSFFSHENILRVFGLNSKVAYLGVNPDEFRVLNLPRKNIVLSVGGVSRLKGYNFVIESIAKVDKSIRPKFLIVGYNADEGWKNYLISLAEELDVDLEFKQGIPYDELIELYNEVKMVIFAPYLEPFGLVPLEASACGTPVIGVNEGGVKETVKHLQNGLLLERDEDVFAEGITELITNQELWDKCSEYGPRYIDEFWTIDRNGERFLKIIYDILDKEKNR